jgi:hypothetical protein
VPVGVGGDQRRWGVPLDGEVAGEVVLDEEGTGRGDRVEHCRPAFGGEHGAVRVGVQRLAIEHSRSRLLEGRRQQIWPDSIGVGGHRDGAQPRSSRRSERSEVGG